MKRAILLIAGGAAVLALVAGTLFAVAYYKGIGTSAEAVDVPGMAPYVPPTATPKVVAPPPLVAGGGSGIAAPNPTPTPAPVNFRLAIEQSRAPQSSALLNATVNVYLRAQLANLGDLDAHNVTITARARIGRDYIAIDGKQALIIPLGAMQARAIITRDLAITLTMSLSQGRTAQSEGILFEIVTTSDEATSYEPLMRCTTAGCAPA